MSSGGGFAFGPFTLDVRARRLLRDGEPFTLPARHFDLLVAFVSRPGEVLSRDWLMQAAWRDQIINDNSLEQVISLLRRRLDPADLNRYIQTRKGSGYEFVAPVERMHVRSPTLDFDALLAPHRALIDGRAALETLETAKIAEGRATFEALLAHHDDDATFHVGLANACALQFEATRTASAPDVATLGLALEHARQACQLNPDFGEAWATLGFILERTGRSLDALAALRRAVGLEPSNWRHHLRHAAGSSGEERLRAALRTLELLPGCPFAHFLAATVYVARNALAEAERHVDAAILAMQGEGSAHARFSAVALHWLKGLLCLARGAEDDALMSFERELAMEERGHLYARECCANAWYAIGAMRLQRGKKDNARAAFKETLARVPDHVRAQIGESLATRPGSEPILVGVWMDGTRSAMDTAIAGATIDVARGDISVAVGGVAAALAAAPAGNTGWTIPIEPLLGVQLNLAAWASVLAMLRVRAS